MSGRGGKTVSIITKRIPEMVSVTISGVQSKELEDAIRLAIIKANRKRKAVGKQKIPYVIITVPKHPGDCDAGLRL